MGVRAAHDDDDGAVCNRGGEVDVEVCRGDRVSSRTVTASGSIWTKHGTHGSTVGVKGANNATSS